MAVAIRAARLYVIETLPGSPFSTGRLLVGPDYRGIDQAVGVVRVFQQRSEDLLPQSSPGPAGEAPVDTLPVTVFGGQVSGPSRPGPGQQFHWTPLRSTHRTPLTNCRLSLAVAPTYPGRPGKKPSIRRHCDALTSYRFMLDPPHRTIDPTQSNTLPPWSKYCPASALCFPNCRFVL